MLTTSMAYLIEVGGITGDETVLELGAGSGETSKTLVHRIHSGQVTLLDASPQMVALATRVFERDNHVDLALCSVPEYTVDHIDLGEREFTTIVIHQSFQDLATAFSRNLEVLGRWCIEKLLPGGRLIVAAHNTVVETERPPGYETWEDEFRRVLYTEIRRIPEWRSHIRPRQQDHLYKPEHIEKSFLSQGFELRRKEKLTIQMSMNERILMWSVPAVMNAIVDVQTGGTDPIDKVCARLNDKFQGLPTMPRTTTYWVFQRS
ncbi:MAG TPA: class I SAM-dependent methyltransferase [Stellaceae bacterium]|nr:class I SAM-dependent methyltransferase [Stellaceae bacterium]